MQKEFVCTVDYAKFNSEEELVKHMIKYHSIEQNYGDKKSDIIKSLEESFPNCSVSVAYNDGIPDIILTLSEYGHTYFNFSIGDDANSYERTFESLEDAIDNYKNMLLKVDKLTKEIETSFHATSIVVEQVNEADTYGDGCSNALLSFYVEGKQYDYSYEFEEIAQAIHKINGCFVDCIEGHVTTDYGSYNSVNTVYIDGIDIRDLAYRAKKMKVEIIEFKD